MATDQYGLMNGMQVQTRWAERGRRSLGHGFIALCLFVLALCLMHQFLMASERHAAVMPPSQVGFMASTGPTIAVPGTLLVHDPVGQPVPPPPPLMGDCPAQQGILPFLLLLSLLLGAVFYASRLLARSSAQGLSSAPRHQIPPLLPPAQRRALLQVFTI